MNITILTLFPDMFQGPFNQSILKKAVEKGLVKIDVRDIRAYTHDQHHTADDYQYGGGPGMVMRPEPIFEGVGHVLASYPEEVREKVPVVLLSPQGRLFNQRIAGEMVTKPGMVIICGHYDGVDERVRENLATDDISVGDYVLTGGELAAMLLVDAVTRLIPGVVGTSENVQGDSITSGVLQHPIYTRPPAFEGYEVPSVLLSGNHAEIARWRGQQSLLRTLKRRPDLLKLAELSEEDLDFLRSRGYDRSQFEASES